MNKNIEYKNDDFTINVVEEPQIYLFDEVSEHDNKIDINNCINKEKIRVFEAFAGYGGASFGLKNAKINYEVIGYSEIDKNAIEIFEYNFRDVKNFGDITKIKENELPDFDLFTGGFPCQPFSTVGKREGELDIRGTLFQDIIRICKKKKPQYILLENVKGLAVGKLKPTFEKILSELKKIGYNVEYSILNTKDYGIPQNRERLWIFGSLKKFPKDFIFEPPKIELQKKLKDFLDENPPEDLYRSKSQIDRIKELHSVDKFDVVEPLCYDYYNRKLKTDGICMTVTPPEHNVIRIVEPIFNGQEKVRKLSIDEHYRLMGFKMTKDYKEIKFPPGQTYSKIGKCAGNGWDVNLVAILTNHIFKQIL
jgi:DNA (cytosine-5)-methyltransferase 1